MKINNSSSLLARHLGASVSKRMRVKRIQHGTSHRRDKIFYRLQLRLLPSNINASFWVTCCHCKFFLRNEKRERERKREKKNARIELRISENCLSAAHQRNHRLRNWEQERESDREKEKIGHVWHVLYELCNNLCALKWRRWHVDEFALFALHSLFHSLAPFFFLSFSHSTFFSLINGNVNSENQNDKE